MNKVGKSFEDLSMEEMSQIQGGGAVTVISAVTPSSLPCAASASVGLLATAAISYFVTRK